MKIIREYNRLYPRMLFEAQPGEVVGFEDTFHQKHAADARFLVLKVPSEYIRADKRNRDDTWRIMVANIESGDVSLITTERAIRTFKAEVKLS